MKNQHSLPDFFEKNRSYPTNLPLIEGRLRPEKFHLEMDKNVKIGIPDLKNQPYNVTRNNFNFC